MAHHGGHRGGSAPSPSRWLADPMPGVVRTFLGDPGAVAGTRVLTDEEKEHLPLAPPVAAARYDHRLAQVSRVDVSIDVPVKRLWPKDEGSHDSSSAVWLPPGWLRGAMGHNAAAQGHDPIYYVVAAELLAYARVGLLPASLQPVIHMTRPPWHQVRNTPGTWSFVTETGIHVSPIGDDKVCVTPTGPPMTCVSSEGPVTLFVQAPPSAAEAAVAAVLTSGLRAYGRAERDGCFSFPTDTPNAASHVIATTPLSEHGGPKAPDDAAKQYVLTPAEMDTLENRLRLGAHHRTECSQILPETARLSIGVAPCGVLPDGMVEHLKNKSASKGVNGVVQMHVRLWVIEVCSKPM
jgi:hypothetical protein